VILLNSSMLDGAAAAAMPGGGTLAFGGSRGFLIVSCQRNSTYSEVNVKITGANGVVWGSSPEYRSWFQVGGANTYAGGTWISGTRVTPNSSKAFGADRDVYVTGNAGWGGQLSFDSSSVSSLDYDLHLAGVGVLFDSQNQGAVRAEKNATLAGTVEFTDDARLCAIGSGVTLTLAGGAYGAGRLETSGGGRIMLTTANASWTGGALVTNGTLVVTVQDALGTGDATVGAGGVLRFENENDVTVTNRIFGAGRIVLAGAGKVTFTGLDDFAGVVELQDGTLNVDGALTVSELLGTGVIAGSGTLYLNADAGTVNGFGGTIKGGVSVVKRGAGTFLLTGRAVYTGATTVEAGTLKLGWDALAQALYDEAVVRLDATDASTFTVDADGNVSAWRDADGRDVVFTNATTALQPVLRTAQLNGLPAVYFGKGSAHLTADKTLGNHTVFLVHRNKSGTRPSGMNAQWNCAGIYGWAGKDKGIRFNGVNYWNWDGWGGNNAAIACNGVDYDPVSRPTPYLTADATTISDVVLPAYQNGELTCLGDYWHDARYGRSYYGDIGEVIVFKRVLSAFERKAVRKRLFAKWGVMDPDGLTSVDTLIRQAAAHLDASDATTLTRDAQDRVLAWRDADGRALSFTNSLPAECPTYVAGAMDGKGALRFDAVYQHLVSTDTYVNHTVFLVHRNKSGNRPSDMGASWGCAGIYGFTGRDCGLRFSSGTAYTTDSSWDNTAYVMRINGVSTPSLTADAVTVAQATLNSAKGGWKTAVGDYWHDMDYNTHTVREYTFKRSYYGDIGEMVVFARALTEDEVTLITDHLMEKWGLKEPVPPEIPNDGNILPPETALTVASGAVVDLAGVSQTVASLSGAGTVGTSGAAATLSLTGGAGVFSGSFGAGVSLALGADATLTLGGFGTAIESIGGSGRVAGGPLTVTDWIRPGGTNAVGTLTFASAPVVDGATLEIEILAGAADQMVVESAFDVSALTIQVPSFAEAVGLMYEAVHTPARTGGIHADNFSAAKKWFAAYDATGVWIKKNAFTVILFR